jgi:hypothetical protein
LRWNLFTVGVFANRSVLSDIFVTHAGNGEPAAAAAMRRLHRYAARGLVRLYDWSSANAFDMPDRLWAYGQLAYTSECIARNEGRARYVIPIDIDEFLFVPQAPADAPHDAIGAMDSVGAGADKILFLSSYMVTGHYACHQSTERVLACHQNDVPHLARSKYAVRPSLIASAHLPVNVHTATPTAGGQMQRVPNSAVRLNHFRNEPLK